MRLREEHVTEAEHFIQSAGHGKNLRVGGDADHPAQDLGSHAVTRIAIDHAVKAISADLMVGRIWSGRVHENVDVRRGISSDLCARFHSK